MGHLPGRPLGGQIFGPCARMVGHSKSDPLRLPAPFRRPTAAKSLIYLLPRTPPLGTIRQIVSRFQMVVFGPRSEGRLFVRAPFRSPRETLRRSSRRRSHDEAAAWAAKAIPQRPTHLPGYLVAMAAHGLAGRIDEARAVYAAYRNLDPDARISNMDRWLRLEPEHHAKWAKGLRLAGMPE